LPNNQPQEKSQPQVCVVTAVDIEFKTVAGLLSQKSFLSAHQIKICQGYIDTVCVTLLQSEIGAINFEPRLAAHLAENQYDGLLVIGLAGALDPKLRTGAIVLYDSCLKISAQTIAASDVGRKKGKIRESIVSLSYENILTNALRDAFRDSKTDCYTGTGITTDKMVIHKDGKLALGTALNALAVDMESYGVIQTGLRYKLPIAVVRVVIDEANQNTPDFNRALTPEGRTKIGALLLEMASHPLVTFHFLQTLRPSLSSLRQAAKVALSNQAWQAFRTSRNDTNRVRTEPMPVDNSNSGR